MSGVVVAVQNGLVKFVESASRDAMRFNVPDLEVVCTCGPYFNFEEGLLVAREMHADLPVIEFFTFQITFGENLITSD